MYLAQGHNAVPPTRLESAIPQSRVKHSTTKSLRSQCAYLKFHAYTALQENSRGHCPAHYPCYNLNLKFHAYTALQENSRGHCPAHYPCYNPAISVGEGGQ